mgnify:CR=1 FL=1
MIKADLKIINHHTQVKLTAGGGEKLYVVMAYWRNHGWGWADCFDLPFIARTYKEAVQMKRDILTKFEAWNDWQPKDFIIAKITLR